MPGTVKLRPFGEADDGARILGASIIGRAELTPPSGGRFEALLVVHGDGYAAVYWQRDTNAFVTEAVSAVDVARASCSCGALVDQGAAGHMPWCARRRPGRVRLGVRP